MTLPLIGLLGFLGINLQTYIQNSKTRHHHPYIILSAEDPLKVSLLQAFKQLDLPEVIIKACLSYFEMDDYQTQWKYRYQIQKSSAEMTKYYTEIATKGHVLALEIFCRPQALHGGPFPPLSFRANDTFVQQALNIPTRWRILCGRQRYHFYCTLLKNQCHNLSQDARNFLILDHKKCQSLLYENGMEISWSASEPYLQVRQGYWYQQWPIKNSDIPLQWIDVTHKDIFLDV